MRKAMIIAAALTMIAYPALASPADPFVQDYNVLCATTGASELTGDPQVEGERYIYHASDAVNVFFNMKGNELQTMSVVCLDESGVGEFLAQCVTTFYLMGGEVPYIDCYDAVLFDFLWARAGREANSNSFVPGFLFKIRKESFGYAFVIVKVK